MSATRRVGISALERLEVLIGNPALYAFGDTVPAQRKSDGGRPRHYPPYMWVLYDALLSVYGSGRRVESELAHPHGATARDPPVRGGPILATGVCDAVLPKAEQVIDQDAHDSPRTRANSAST